MSEEVQKSLVLRTGTALAAVILLAVINMVASYLTAESTENDAVRINLAGSLRMQAYRMANAFILGQNDHTVSEQARLQRAVDEFEQRFNRPVLAGHIRASGNEVLQQAFAIVSAHWEQVRPMLLSADTPRIALLERIDSFVADIDGLVKKLELQTESKFRVLRLIQGVSLLLTLALATVMFLNVYKYVVGPLNQLVIMASRIRAGDFSMQLDSRGDDELALLAATFNDMAASLDDMYRSLEHKVQIKTRHLETTQEALRFLYDSSRGLSAQGNIVGKLQRTANQLQQQLDAHQVDIALGHEAPDQPFLVSSSGQNAAQATPAEPSGVIPAPRVYPLQHEAHDYGELTLFLRKGRALEREQELMVQALADTVAAALANEVRKDQEHRVALMDERAAIARDLHDSLAQSLSFTKIQISRFKALQARQARSAQLEEVLAEITTGINSAYRQLRELLATFRLQLNSPGLRESLESTVQEFQGKGALAIDLDYGLQNYPLTPNEEIHILQIVREALSNVLRHANADKAAICLLSPNEEQVIEVTITDNGRGLQTPAADHNHFGQAIMRERAALLDGTISFDSPPQGGARVRLRFIPENATLEASEPAHLQQVAP